MTSISAPSIAPGARRALLVRLGGAAVACLLGLLAVVNPALALAAVLSMFLAAGFLRSATFGICAFAFVTYFEVVTAYAGAGALSPVKVTGGALILVALLDLLSRTRFGVRRPAPVWSNHLLIVASLVALLAVGIASSSWAVNLLQVRLLSELLVTDALVFLAVGVLLLRRSQLYALSCTLVWAGALSTVLGLLLGAASFERAVGAFQDPNEYGAAMMVSMVVGAGAYGVARTTPGRRAILAGIAVSGYGLLESESRGAFIALAGAGLVLVLTARGRERARLMGATFFLAAAAAAVLFLTPSGMATLERVTTGDSSGRADLWRIARAQFVANPVHGVGLGNYQAVANRYLTRDIEHSDLVLARIPRTTHNSYLEIAAELGVLGIVAFGSFFFGCVLLAMRGIRRARRLGDPDLVRLGRGLTAATVGLLLSCLFLSGHYNELLWVLLASCLAFAEQVRRLEVEAARTAAAVTAMGDDLLLHGADLSLVDGLDATTVEQLGTLERA